MTCYICQPKREERQLDIIYRLHHTEPITNIKFSPDAYYLVTFTPADAFKVSFLTGKQAGKYTSKQAGRQTGSQAGRKASRLGFQVGE